MSRIKISKGNNERVREMVRDLVAMHRKMGRKTTVGAEIVALSLEMPARKVRSLFFDEPVAETSNAELTRLERAEDRAWLRLASEFRFWAEYCEERAGRRNSGQETMVLGNTQWGGNRQVRRCA